MYWWVATPPKHHLLWIAQIYDKFNDIETVSYRGRSVFPESRNLLSVIVEHPTIVWTRALIIVSIATNSLMVGERGLEPLRRSDSF